MSRSKKTTGLVFAISVLMALGCATGTKLSPMQKRQTTTKLIEGSFEDVYRATLTVLQDQDYIIQNTDMNAGLIVAEVKRESGSSLFKWIFTDERDTRKGVEVTAMVNKINDTNSEVRLSIQETTYKKDSKQDAKQIYDPKVFQNFFNQIIVECKRREAMK